MADARDDQRPADVDTDRGGHRRWRAVVAAYVALGVGVAAVEVLATPPPEGAGTVLLAVHGLLGLLIGGCVALARFRPALALALTALVDLASPVWGFDGSLDELALALVTYHCARRGRPATVWASGAYIPAAYVLGGFYTVGVGSRVADEVQRTDPTALPSLVLFAAAVVAPLALPWLSGLALRMRARALENRERQLRAEADRAVARALQAKAEAVAASQEQQASLARDVHDVVGHSLAVILAQAESVQYLEEPAPEPVRLVLQNIIRSARSSLEDVRAVLAPESRHSEVATLDDLVDRFPAEAGRLRSRVVGTPRPLPPDVAVVATRVLQEMLTNALRHGTRHEEVEVLRDWTDGLRLQVSNSAEPQPRGDGLGLAGMRRRVESTGGRLRVEDGGRRFTVTATLPLCGSRHGADR